MANDHNPLHELEALGQAIWLDSIRRGQILSGELQQLRDRDGLSGETANPTIFEKAIGGSSDYDSVIQELVKQGKSPLEIYETIAIEDVRMACDVFRPIYDKTGGADGFVSIEVSPRLAYDTRGTINEARRFFRQVDRPNVMIKIPGTPEGVPAIEQCLYEGININITLLFAVAAYDQVAWAYIRALERRLEEGKPIHNVASVASFFVSRIDTLADKMVQEKLRASNAPELNSRLEGLGGKVAIANAKVAYEHFRAIFGDPRFIALKDKANARVQRPLWASTSTKNPQYSDVLYVESLIGPDTVNTLPLETIEAYDDHGHPRVTIDEDLDGARRVLETLSDVGLSIDAITDQVLQEGVVKFEESLDKLLQVIADKRAEILSGNAQAQSATLGMDQGEVQAALEAADRNHVAERVWNKDVTLWKPAPQLGGAAPEEQAEIRNRLGWLDVASKMREHVAELTQFANEIKDAQFQSVVLCGMGGSSLSVEVFDRTFGSARRYPELHVLDTTDPATILNLEKKLDVTRTLFVISSKSGSTTETTDQYRFFSAKVREKKGDRAGENFVAITDPESTLAKTAQEENFRRVFLNPEDIGGRYSALSYFGLVPAALIGVDLTKILDGAEAMMQASGANVPARENPGAWFGVLLGTLAQRGRNKVTIITSPGIGSFGTWAEQLIAESTGKEGKGLVPVADEPLGPPKVYGDDRIFVYLHLATDKTAALDKKVDALQAAGQPVVHLRMENVYDLGGEFFRWEMAIAVAGALLGIDVFDQPNVQESKDNTKRVLQAYEQNHSFEEGAPAWEGAKAAVYWAQRTEADKSLRENLAAFLEQCQAGDYLAIMAYVEQTPKSDAAFEEMRTAARDVLKIATTLGYGPRFLHSTGQLHKGGPNTVLALQVTADDAVDVPIPGEDYSFSVLKHAQAIGDWQSLITHGRRALRIHLKRGARLQELVAAFRGALYPERAAAKRPKPTPHKKTAARKVTKKAGARTTKRTAKRPARKTATRKATRKATTRRKTTARRR